MVSGVMAERVWRESAPFASRVLVPAVPDPRYAGVRQYAMLMESDFEPSARAGDFVICAAWDEVRTAPLVGDLVHLVVARGDLEEHTLRLAERGGHGIRLSSPNTELVFVAMDGSMPENVEIRGLYLATYRPPR